MKKHIVLSGAFFLCALLAGCASGKPERKENQTEKEPIVLWSYYETEAQQDGLDYLIREFNLSQDVYEASWEYIPMTEFDRKLAMAYTEQALPDLVLIDNPAVPMRVQMGMFEDLTEFLQGLEMEKTYYPEIIKTVRRDGRLYGLPAVCNNTALIYNKKYLEEARIDPPKTWEELEDAAARLTTEQRCGFLLSGVAGEQGAFEILPWILSTGERPDEIGGEGTIKAFAFLEGLMEKGYMTRNCINLSQTDVARVFIQGGTAMMENGPWAFPMLEEADIDFGVCALPIDRKSSVIIGGEVFSVLKGKNREGAECFLEYYNQDKTIREFCEKTGALPAKMSVSITAWPKMQVFEEQMDGAIARTEIPSWNLLSEDLTAAFYRIAAKELSPEQAALELKKKK